MAIDSIRRDSAKQLLVIKLKEEFNWEENIVVNFRAGIPLREDQKGLHRIGHNLIKANFGNSEARLIMPCFDDPEHKAAFDFKLMTKYHLGLRSREIDTSHEDENKGGISFVRTQPISISDLWFELFY